MLICVWGAAVDGEMLADSRASGGPVDAHHLDFYTSVDREVKRITDPMRAHQPIDTSSSFVREFRNRATLMNRGLEQARHNILQNKEQLDALLQKEIDRIRENITKEEAASKQRIDPGNTILV